MPLIEIPGQGLVEFPSSMSHEDITAAVRRLAGPVAEERPPGPGVPAGEGALKPSFLEALGASAKERIGEIGQLPGDLAKFGGEVTRVGSSMVPGPFGGLAAGAGSLAADVMQGESPDLKRAGIAGGTTAALGGLGKLLAPLSKLRFGANPGSGVEKVAETVQRTAPPALRPATATAEGLSDVMRGGAGKAGLKASREEGLGGLYRELQVAEKAAVSEVPGKAEGFKKLVTELADANRAAYNPATAEARTGALSLVPQRDRAAILSEIQSMLSPDQWAKFQALQKEFAQGSDLLRLFKPTKSGTSDVLLKQSKLQDRAKDVQDRLDPELMKSIFRGGRPPRGDRPINIPIGLPMFGSIPGTIMAGPGMDQRLLQMLLQGGGAGLSQALQP